MTAPVVRAPQQYAAESPIDETDRRATGDAGEPVDRRTAEVVVIGGGQAGLAAGYYLRRAKVDFAILDAQPGPGGAWRHGWESLRLFSPARHSPLPGWWMPDQPGEPFPTAGHVRRYLADYETRYQLPVHRNVEVVHVHARAGHFEIRARRQRWQARAVVSATGTWRCPHWPRYPGRDAFGGTQIHTVSYRTPEPFVGQRVVVVGGGNSAAQILAEVSTVADTIWVTARPPRFLPDDVDGRAFFDPAARVALAARHGRDGRHGGGVADLGDIVMVPPVRAARDRGVLHAEPMFQRLTPDGVAWHDGRTRTADSVIWCTGFRPDLRHLAPLQLTMTEAGLPATEGTRSADHRRLHLLGYGDWTGAASATLIGASRTARTGIGELLADLRGTSEPSSSR